MTRSLAFSFFGLLTLSAASAGCDGTSVQPTPLAVTAVFPTAGSMLGATPVTISGHGFKAGATVQFGGVPALASAVSPTSITATAPAHSHGSVTVVVTNPGGESASRESAYTYEVDPPFAISGIVTEMTADGEMPVEGVRVAESATLRLCKRTAEARIGLAVFADRPSTSR